MTYFSLKTFTAHNYLNNTNLINSYLDDILDDVWPASGFSELT